MDVEAVSAALEPHALAPRIAKRLGLSAKSVQDALELLAAGSQPAFVANYRSHRVAGLSIVELERIQANAARVAAFEFKRQEVLDELRRKDPVDERAIKHAENAEHPLELEDVKAIARRRKRGPAAKARAAGLTTIADAVWAQASQGPRAGEVPEGFTFESATEQAVGEAFADVPSVVAAVQSICAEQIADDPGVRAALRTLMMERGRLRTSVVEAKKEKAGRYTKFFDREEVCTSVASSTMLAIGRGEREGMLKAELELDREPVLAAIGEQMGIDPESEEAAPLRAAAVESWEHILGKSVRAGVRKLLKERADRQAIAEFSEVLRPLLMAPPLGAKPVLSIDPGHQNGCRVAVLDAAGQMVADDLVYPLQPKLQVPQAKARWTELCRAHNVAVIVVASGAAGREVERLCRVMVREAEELQGTVAVASVDPDAAAVHAASRAAKAEFPNADVALRRAVSAGRRVQDPLAELSKVDPRKLGLGQHQQEVDHEELRAALEQVVVSCVCEVGLDVNTAGADQLARVAGMSQALARAVVGRRQEQPIRARSELLDLPGFAGKAFEQASGFLRVLDGEHPLDGTRVHPERYGQVTQMARDVGAVVADLVGSGELIAKIERSKYEGTPGLSGEPLDALTFDRIVEQLREPAKDPRPEFVAVEFDPQLASFDDLSVGMDLEGIVTHLTGFGAFVDVGLSQDGLVHVSELCHGFISTPQEAVHVGQRVKGRVLEVSKERKRFSLSLKALEPRPERPARSEKKGGGRRKKGGGKDDAGRGGRRGNRDRGDRKERRPDRGLGFRMDLSELASRLKDG